MMREIYFWSLWRRHRRRNKKPRGERRTSERRGGVSQRTKTIPSAPLVFVCAFCACASDSRVLQRGAKRKKEMAAIRLVGHSVTPATAVTHPSPQTFVILRRKSTEFRLGGFHLRMSSHLPALYFCTHTYTHAARSRWDSTHSKKQRRNSADLNGRVIYEQCISYLLIYLFLTRLTEVNWPPFTNEALLHALCTKQEEMS